MTKQCWIWKIERMDGRVFCSTDHNEDIQIGEEIYRAHGAFRPSRVEAELGLELPNMEILGGVNGEDITLEDLNAGLFLHAKVTQTAYDFESHQIGEEIFCGEIARIEYSEGRFEAELRAPLAALDHVFGRSYVKDCQAKFCDKDCGLDLARFTEHLTVERSEGNVLWLDGDLFDYPLENGWLRRKEDVEALSAHIIKSAAKKNGLWRVELQSRRDRNFTAGEEVAITAACDHSLESCSKVYGNAKNFRGFPHMPGEEIINVSAEQKIAKS